MPATNASNWTETVEEESDVEIIDRDAQQENDDRRTFTFPGKYGQPGDEFLVDKAREPVVSAPKPKPIPIELIDEECLYSSDEEEWEKPQPPKMPSLQIEVDADANDQAIEEAATAKRNELQRYLKAAERYSAGWEEGSPFQRAHDQQKLYDRDRGKSKDAAPHVLRVDTKLDSCSAKATREESQKRVGDNGCWLKDDNICSVDRFVGGLTLDNEYRGNEALSAILITRACDVLNASVIPRIHEKLRGSQTMAGSPCSTSLELNPQIGGEVRFVRTALLKTNRKKMRQPEPTVQRGSSLTTESGEHYNPIYCLPQEHDSQRQQLRRLEKEVQIQFSCNLTSKEENGDEQIKSCKCTLAYDADKGCFRFELVCDPSDGAKKQVMKMTIDPDIVDQVMTPARWEKQWLVDEREKHGCPDPVNVKLLEAVADGLFQDLTRLVTIAVGRIGASYFEGHAFDLESARWVKDDKERALLKQLIRSALDPTAMALYPNTIAAAADKLRSVKFHRGLAPYQAFVSEAAAKCLEALKKLIKLQQKSQEDKAVVAFVRMALEYLPVVFPSEEDSVKIQYITYQNSCVHQVRKAAMEDLLEQVQELRGDEAGEQDNEAGEQDNEAGEQGHEAEEDRPPPKKQKKGDAEQIKTIRLTQAHVVQFLKGALLGHQYLGISGALTTQYDTPALVQKLAENKFMNGLLTTIDEQLRSKEFVTDTNVHLVPFSDGITIVLSKGEPPQDRPSRESDHMTRSVPLNYKDVEPYRKRKWKNGKKPPLRRFAERCLRRMWKGGGKAYVDYKFKWQAMTLYGDCNFLGSCGQRVVLKSGTGANGKSEEERWNEATLGLAAQGGFACRARRSMWVSGDGGSGHQQEDVASLDCSRYVASDEMKQDFMTKIDLEFLKDLCAGGVQSAMKKWGHLLEVRNHAQGVHLSLNVVGELLTQFYSIARRLEEHRHTTTFTSRFDTFQELRASGDAPCYQADTIDVQTLAPALMAIWLDLWEEMVAKNSWPVEQPPIIKRWLNETSQQNHKELHAWLEDQYVKAKDVVFTPEPTPQRAVERIRQEAGIDAFGLRESCKPNAAKVARWVEYQTIKKNIEKEPNKSLRDQYLRSTGNSLDEQKLKRGVVAFFGELKDKMPEYYPEGDVSKKKVRGKPGFAGWQGKIDAIAEAKALYCKASFCNTNMPSDDPAGLMTPPLDTILLKERMTPTATVRASGLKENHNKDQL